jgi:hypothetical protein
LADATIPQHLFIPHFQAQNVTLNLNAFKTLQSFLQKHAMIGKKEKKPKVRGAKQLDKQIEQLETDLNNVIKEIEGIQQDNLEEDSDDNESVESSSDDDVDKDNVDDEIDVNHVINAPLERESTNNKQVEINKHVVDSDNSDSNINTTSEKVKDHDVDQLNNVVSDGDISHYQL